MVCAVVAASSRFPIIVANSLDRVGGFWPVADID